MGAEEADYVIPSTRLSPRDTEPSSRPGLGALTSRLAAQARPRSPEVSPTGDSPLRSFIDRFDRPSTEPDSHRRVCDCPKIPLRNEIIVCTRVATALAAAGYRLDRDVVSLKRPSLGVPIQQVKASNQRFFQMCLKTHTSHGMDYRRLGVHRSRPAGGHLSNPVTAYRFDSRLGKRPHAR